ncbi:MAG: DnaA/Hda family protein [bacterium]|nr:DnaA/Hda family protein [bacterium]
MAKQLGELLIEQRLITKSMLEQALELQQQRRLPLGKILLQLGYVTEEDLNTILAKQFGSIYINPRGFVVKDINLLTLIPEPIARQYICFPLEKNEEQLTVAMSDPWDTDAIQKLTELTKLTIRPIFSRREWIEQIIDKYYPTVKSNDRSLSSDTITGIFPITAVPEPNGTQSKPVESQPISSKTDTVMDISTPQTPVQPSAAVVPDKRSLDTEQALDKAQLESLSQQPNVPLGLTPSTSTESHVSPQPQPHLSSPEPTQIQPSLLTKPIPEFTFDSFVVGTGNQLAWAAAKNVAESPGTTYNPLFIYGGVGLGKTHLMNAIGNLILQKNPHSLLVYIPCTRFIEEMITAIASGTITPFRQKYWHLQVLLIDDVQFLAGQERTQVELFQMFEELHHRRAQIVLTSDRLPKDIPQLEERLRSRFEGGLIVDVQMPDLETRIAILRRKAMQRNLQLPDDIANVIATFISTNVRELEGVLNKINAISSLGGRPITMQVVQNILSEMIKQGR